MPFALLLFAIMLIVIGFQGTEHEFFALLNEDFNPNVSGSWRRTFWAWIIAIGVVGGIGYLPKMRQISNVFLALILVVLFLSNGGVFANFTKSFGIQPKTGVIP